MNRQPKYARPVYLKPEEHPDPRSCALCKVAPYCDQCYGHHEPLIHVTTVPQGPRPTRVVVIDGKGAIVGKPIASFPSGVEKDEDAAAALKYARERPGERAAVEKRGTWFDTDKWERFLIAGPFDEQGNPIHVRDEGSERRAAYLRAVAESAERREAEKQAEAAKAAADGKPVADLGRKKRSRRW